MQTHLIQNTKPYSCIRNFCRDVIIQFAAIKQHEHFNFDYAKKKYCGNVTPPTPKMNVEYANSDDNRKGYEEHAEEKIFAEQGNSQRRRRNYLSQKQEEHCQGEKNGDAEGDLG